MDELTQMPSRLGQISAAVAALDFAVTGILLLIAVFASEFLSIEQIELRRRLEFVGFAAFFIFPVAALIGLAIGVIGLFIPNYAKFYSLLGIALNVVNLLLWAGIVVYQVTFNANRFRL